MAVRTRRASFGPISPPKAHDIPNNGKWGERFIGLLQHHNNSTVELFEVLLENFLASHKEWDLVPSTEGQAFLAAKQVGGQSIEFPSNAEYQSKFNSLAATLQLSGKDLYHELLDAYEAAFKKPLSEFVGGTQNDIDANHGAWHLVRRVSANSAGMHPTVDRLQGTATYGEYTSATADNDFSVPFEEYGFDEFLFASGDLSHWLICSKYQATAFAGYNCRKIIKLAHNSDSFKFALWMNRAENQEDPWISYEDHFYSEATPCCTMLYGEAAYNDPNVAHSQVRKEHNGLNVWIRHRQAPTYTKRAQ